MERIFMLATGVALAAIVPSAALATTTYSFSTTFSKSGQNAYGAGTGIDMNTGPQRLGPDPVHVDETIDHRIHGCVWFVCGSAGVRAGVSGDFDVALDYGVKINSGTMDVNYPIAVQLTAPDAGATLTGHAFQLQSDYGIPGITSTGISFGGAPTGSSGRASVQVHTPTIEAFVDLHAKVDAFIGAEACAGVCSGPALDPPSVDKTQNLFAFNKDGLGKLEIGNDVYALGDTFTTLGGNVTGQLSLPNLDATSKQTGIFSPTNLTTFAQSNLAVVNADISGIIGNALGIPLSGDLGPIKYDLFNASAGLGLALRQQVSVDFVPTETYNFLSPVQQMLPDGSWGAPTLQIKTTLGDDLTLKSYARSIGVMPVTSLEAHVTNTTQLIVSANIIVQALHANGLDIDIGPLINYKDLDAPLFAIDLGVPDFSFSFGEVVGSPFNIVQYFSDSISSTPGSSIGLFAVGADADDPTLEDTAVYSRALDCGKRLCPLEYIRDGNPVTFDGAGSAAYLETAQVLAGLPDVAPGVIDSDESLTALLRSVGWTGDPAQLPHSIGQPLPAVPEPASWAMMLLGFAVIGASARAQRAARPSGPQFG